MLNKKVKEKRVGNVFIVVKYGVGRVRVRVKGGY